MRFEARTFWLPKDADETAQYQDAFALDAETGRAAIADGVSSAIFSGPWARLLTLGVIAEPPPLDDAAAFQTWLADKRAAWLNSVDTSKLTWYQRPKMVDGAMTTLLWLELLPTETNEAGLATRYGLQTFAIGDTCLFHLRDDELLYWFPLERSSQFGLNPAVVASVDQQLDHLLEFRVREHDCLPGDLLVLATDAVALWAVERQESGEAVAWPRYWDYSDEDWRAEIFSLRDAKQMRFDDSTLVLLRVIQEQPAPTVDYDELIGPDLALTADEAPLPDDGAPAEAVAEGDRESVEAQPASDDMDQTPVASLTEAVEGGDALRFDAAVDETIDALKQVAATAEEPADEAVPVTEKAADEADPNDHDPTRTPT
ncbi:MAG TPA: hypothetical protein VFI31_08795 [Pirellulales bacterium]|nr:hypothetical protein [Pirellulales bacterium]